MSNFKTMSKEEQRALASRGGVAAHASGNAHQFTKEAASAAGKRGGANVVAKYGRDHMSSIGSKGGQARRKQTANDASIECFGTAEDVLKS